MSDVPKLVLTIVGNGEVLGNKSMTFKVTPQTRFGKIIHVFLKSYPFELDADNDLRFLYNGKRVREHTTPQEIGIADGSKIDCFAESCYFAVDAIDCTQKGVAVGAPIQTWCNRFSKAGGLIDDIARSSNRSPTDIRLFVRGMHVMPDAFLVEYNVKKGDLLYVFSANNSLELTQDLQLLKQYIEQTWSLPPLTASSAADTGKLVLQHSDSPPYPNSSNSDFKSRPPSLAESANTNNTAVCSAVTTPSQIVPAQPGTTLSPTSSAGAVDAQPAGYGSLCDPAFPSSAATLTGQLADVALTDAVGTTTANSSTPGLVSSDSQTAATTTANTNVEHIPAGQGSDCSFGCGGSMHTTAAATTPTTAPTSSTANPHSAMATPHQTSSKHLQVTASMPTSTDSCQGQQGQLSIREHSETATGQTCTHDMATQFMSRLTRNARHREGMVLEAVLNFPLSHTKSLIASGIKTRAVDRAGVHRLHVQSLRHFRKAAARIHDLCSPLGEEHVQAKEVKRKLSSIWREQAEPLFRVARTVFAIRDEHDQLTLDVTLRLFDVLTA